jgi:hypothetical protein
MGKTFSLVQNVVTVFADPPASYSVGNGVISQVGHEVDHSPPSSVEFKNEWCYDSALLVCLHGVYRDSFTFSVFQLTMALCHDSKVSCRSDAASD